MYKRDGMSMTGEEAVSAEGLAQQGGEQLETGVGVSTPSPSTDPMQVQNLASSFVPEMGKHRREGRLIVVGDVHGMKESLVKLLDKVKFDQKKDHLVLAGDIISKGPDSPGVVDLAMKLGASSVRGNHEDRVLHVHADMEAEHVDMSAPGPAEHTKQEEDEMEDLSNKNGRHKDRALVKALGPHRLKWLKKCPVILKVGDCGSLGEVVVVHAGLAPGVPLASQDPTMVMNMRTISHDGVPSDGREGKSWYKVWNKFQEGLAPQERTTVIYGHDSKRGLQIGKYSMGIDTGCLKGGKLTAVVIEGALTDYNTHLVSVACPEGRSGG